MQFVAAYVRVSTMKQAMEGVSIDMQKQYIIKIAKMMNEIKSEKEIHFYIDDGYSGKTLSRPAMSQLINDIKQNQVKIVFTYDLSRISRDIIDSSVFFNLLKRHNVLIKCLNDETNIKTAGGRFSTNVKIVANQFEREKIVERTNDGLMSIVESGRYPIGGKMFFGYARDKNKNICLHEKNYLIVKEMFRMGMERYTLTDITSYANSVQNERIFTTDQIMAMFRDKRYAGILEYKGKTYDNIIPPIVSLEELENVSLNYRKTKFKKNKEYYFDDLVYCNICGTRMTCTHSYGRKNIYYYYYCRLCKQTISQKALEEYVSMMEMDEPMKKEYMKVLDKEIFKVNKKIKNVRQKYLDEVYTDREYIALAIPLEDRLEELSIRRNGIKQRVKKIEYKNLVTKEEKKEYVQSNFLRFKVDPIKKRVIDVECI